MSNDMLLNVNKDPNDYQVPESWWDDDSREERCCDFSKFYRGPNVGWPSWSHWYGTWVSSLHMEPSNFLTLFPGLCCCSKEDCIPVEITHWWTSSKGGDELACKVRNRFCRFIAEHFNQSSFSLLDPFKIHLW